MRASKFFFSFCLLLLCSCADTRKPIEPGNVTMPSTGVLRVSANGTITSANTSKFHIKKGCFTCADEAITVQYCDSSSCSSSSSLVNSIDYLEITMNQTPSAGTYYLILQEGAMSGYQDSTKLKLFSSDDETPNNDIFSISASLYTFTVD